MNRPATYVVGNEAVNVLTIETVDGKEIATITCASDNGPTQAEWDRAQAICRALHLYCDSYGVKIE